MVADRRKKRMALNEPIWLDGKKNNKSYSESEFKEGQLYKLRGDETIVIALKAKRFKNPEVLKKKWRVWFLPDHAPSYRTDLATGLPSLEFEKRQEKIHLFAPIEREKDLLDPSTYDPTNWGLTRVKLHYAFNDASVVINLGDVPDNVLRSGAHAYLEDLIKSHNSGGLGASAYIGSFSDTAYAHEFVNVKLADLITHYGIIDFPPPSKDASATTVVAVSGVVPAAAPVPATPVYKHGNSGRTYNFEAGTNSFTNELGWKPIDLHGGGKGPAFDPVAPAMAVHDLMEHFPGDEYEPHNEYMAQGAMLWLRFEGGFFASTGLAEAVVKPAFGMLFYHIAKQNLDTKPVEAVIKDLNERAKVLQHGMVPETFMALNLLITRVNEYIETNLSPAGSNLSTKKKLRESLTNGVPWMLLGYANARIRYNGLERNRLVTMFRNASEQISKVVPAAKLQLTLDYENYTSKAVIEYSKKA